MRKVKKNYINNSDFYQALIRHKNAVEEAERAGKLKPVIPNYIGECILLIANRLAMKGNFSSYSYLDEMISDGVRDSIQYLDNFDPDRYNNPFAYFTQITYNAFIRRIGKEKKQQYIKYKNGARMQMAHQEEFDVPFDYDHNEIQDEFINDFERKLREKKK